MSNETPNDEVHKLISELSDEDTAKLVNRLKAEEPDKA